MVQILIALSRGITDAGSLLCLESTADRSRPSDIKSQDDAERLRDKMLSLDGVHDWSRLQTGPGLSSHMRLVNRSYCGAAQEHVLDSTCYREQRLSGITIRLPK